MGSDQQANLFRVLIERLRAYAAAGDIERAKRIAHTAVEASRRSAEGRDEGVPSLLDALREFAGVHLRDHDLTSALSIYREAFQVSQDNQYVSDYQVASLKGEYAVALDMHGDLDEAIPFYQDAIQTLESDTVLEPLLAANLRNNLGMIFRDRNDLASAEEHYLIALEVFEKHHGSESEPVAAMHNNIGALYQAASHLDRAVEMHMRARDIRLKLTGPHSIDTGQSLANIAAAYHGLRKSEEAAIYYLRAQRALAQHHDTELYQITSENFEVLKEQYPDVKTITLTEESSPHLQNTLMEMPL